MGKTSLRNINIYQGNMITTTSVNLPAVSLFV